MIPVVSDPLLQLSSLLLQHHYRIVTAESCTGGGIAAAITSLPGSSSWFWGGFITYHNQAKVNLLNVKEEDLDQFGAVSRVVAAAMASGALRNSSADWAVSVSGIAGPGGGTRDKPVGTVWVGVAGFSGYHSEKRYQFSGSREEVREQAVRESIIQLISGIFGEAGNN